MINKRQLQKKPKTRISSPGYGRKKSEEWDGPVLHGHDLYNKSNPRQMREELQKLIRNHYTGRK